MWRHAHGRLAAIAMLGGGLLACAPAPKPVARAAAPAEEDDSKMEPADERANEPSCGGTVPGPPAAHDVVEVIEEKVRAKCTDSATSGGRHGEVRVVLHVDPIRQSEPNQIHPWRPKVETELHFDLTEDDRRCVESAATAAFGFLEDQLRLPIEAVWSEMRKDVTVYVALGHPKPLFPPRPDLIDRWLAARSSAARERLRRRLPAYVTLTDDDCLSMVKRPAYTDRVEAWLATVGTPLDAYWKGGDQAVDRPVGKWLPRRYLVGSRTTVVHYQEVGDRRRQEICLLPFDDFLLEQLQARGVCSVTAHGRVRCGPDRGPPPI